jgi:hypothetical protein
MRLGLITSNHIRHRYLANRLAREFDLALVLAEEKQRDPSRTVGSPEEQALLKDYFAERAEAEAGILEEGREWDRSSIGGIVAVPAGEINDPKWPETLVDGGVDLVAVFGSSILGEPWLDRFPAGIINIHLGLSPYYRGAATNFWALFYEEPEYVGATIHLIDAGVDSGAILRHARPIIGRSDTPHTIGNGAIREGARALCRSIREYQEGRIEPVPQWDEPNARYTRNRDFTPAVLEDFLRRWDGGLLDRFLPDRERRMSSVKLVRELDHEQAADLRGGGQPRELRAH